MSLYWKLRCKKFSPADRLLLLRIWENILKTRLFEEKVSILAREGKIKKRLLFSGKGQEGGQAAVCTLLKNGDYLLPSRRGCCPVISRGFPLGPIAAEVLSKKTGVMGGQGVAYSFTAPEYGIYQHSSILGANAGTLVGMALNLARKKDDSIAVTFFGDGTATRGPVWSAINLSVVWKLPILWVCDNNQYSISTPILKIFKSSFSKEAASCGLTAKSVDSNDVVTSLPAIKSLINYVRRERRPAFLELKTYRVTGHDMFFLSDQWYQDPKEMSYWLARDPLIMLEKKLLKGGILSCDYAFKIKEKLRKEVEKDFDRAEKDPELFIEEILTEKL